MAAVAAAAEAFSQASTGQGAALGRYTLPALRWSAAGSGALAGYTSAGPIPNEFTPCLQLRCSIFINSFVLVSFHHQSSSMRQ